MDNTVLHLHAARTVLNFTRGILHSFRAANSSGLATLGHAGVRGTPLITAELFCLLGAILPFNV